MSVFDKWANSVSKEEEAEQREQVQKAKENQYVEIPSGTYPVTVEKIEIGQSNWGTDQVNIQFKILDGEYKGKMIFYNGTFDDHFAHGINSTGILIAKLLDDPDRAAMVSAILNHGVDEASEFLLDVTEEIVGKLSYDLKYDVKESNKINPNNNKPYINKFYGIEEVFDM